MIKFIKVNNDRTHNINVNHIVDMYELYEKTYLILTTNKIMTVENSVEDILNQINN